MSQPLGHLRMDFQAGMEEAPKLIAFASPHLEVSFLIQKRQRSSNLFQSRNARAVLVENLH